MRDCKDNNNNNNCNGNNNNNNNRDCRDNMKEFKNRAELEVICEGQEHKVFSNTVEARKADVRIHKSQGKRCFFEGDMIEYTIDICNASGFKLCGAKFIDKLPHGLRFVEDSFRVNGHRKHAHFAHDTVEFELGELDCGNTVITFCCRVM